MYRQIYSSTTSPSEVSRRSEVRTRIDEAQMREVNKSVTLTPIYSFAGVPVVGLAEP